MNTQANLNIFTLSRPPLHVIAVSGIKPRYGKGHSNRYYFDSSGFIDSYCDNLAVKGFD